MCVLLNIAGPSCAARPKMLEYHPVLHTLTMLRLVAHDQHHCCPTAATDRPFRRSGGDRAPGAVAVDGDRARGKPPATHPVRPEGGRSPDLQRVNGVDHDVAVVQASTPAGPGIGKTARLSGATRDQLPARRARREVPGDTADLRRAPELPQP